MNILEKKEVVENVLFTSSFFTSYKLDWKFHTTDPNTYSKNGESLKDFTKPEEIENLKLNLYTSENQYVITIGKDYLGCVFTSRKNLPGEDWSRGRDLHDGKFNKETLAKIVIDILGNECKTVERHKETFIDLDTKKAT